MDQEETKGQTKKAGSWKNTLIFILLIFLIPSGTGNYFLVVEHFETQQKIEKLESEVRNWESMFRNFYFYADRDWPEAERYAVGILTKAFSTRLAEEQGWDIKDQIDWESDPEKGESYIKKILK